MNLLDRYLQAVARCLPRGRRDDIIAELRANIVSQFEDREEELELPLSDDEQAAILRSHGNPVLIAGRYSEHNLGFAFGKQLIGPELFPIYRTVLTINFALTLIILAGVIPLVSHAAIGVVTLGRILTPLAMQFVIVTFVFVLLDRNRDSVFGNWNPRQLPALKPNPEEGPTPRNLFNFIAAVIGTLWLALTPNWPYLLLGPGAAYLQAVPIKLMPQWTGFYWAIIALLCGQLMLRFLNLFGWIPRRQARRIDLNLKVIGLVIGFLLLLHFPKYVSSPDQQLADWANWTLLTSVVVALGINLWGTGRLLLSFWREQDNRAERLSHKAV